MDLHDDHIFRWSRDPDPAWVRELARIAPRRDQVSHLTIRWVPMHDLRPAQRWVIFECVPAFAARHMLAHLVPDGPLDPLRNWAWKYFGATGTIPTPFWIVQGSAAGHPWSYNPMERAWAKMGAIPATPPPIGSLAYREPNDWTWDAISQRSTLHRRVRDAWTARVLAQHAAQRAVRQSEITALSSRMADTIAEHGAKLYADYTKVVDRGSRALANVRDDDIDRYIETGNLPLPNTTS